MIKPIRLLLLRRMPESADAYYEDDMRDQIKDEATAARLYIEFEAPELDIEIFYSVTRIPYDPSDRWNKKVFKQYCAVNDLGGFVPTHFIMVDGANNDRCGEAEQFYNGGQYAKVYTNNPTSACGPRTIAHELFHLLNTGHVGTIKSGRERTYGSNDGVMGVSGVWLGLAAPTVFNLGFYTEQEIMRITHSMIITLAPLELRERDLFPDECRFAYIGKDKTLISFRKAEIEYPFAQQKGPERLYVHRLGAYQVDNKGKKFWDTRCSRLYLPWLEPGKTLTLPSGTQIEHMAYADEQAVVRVTL